jgi:hypothetical protein
MQLLRDARSELRIDGGEIGREKTRGLDGGSSGGSSV